MHYFKNKKESALKALFNDLEIYLKTNPPENLHYIYHHGNIDYLGHYFIYNFGTI